MEINSWLKPREMQAKGVLRKQKPDFLVWFVVTGSYLKYNQYINVFKSAENV